MRPAGEIRQVLLRAATDLTTPERAPTVRELAHHAGVGLEAARRTVDNLKRCGALEIARPRRVAYRNRPVAEYQPVRMVAMADAENAPFVDLARVLGGWQAAPMAQAA